MSCLDDYQSETDVATGRFSKRSNARMPPPPPKVTATFSQIVVKTRMFLKKL